MELSLFMRAHGFGGGFSAREGTNGCAKEFRSMIIARKDSIAIRGEAADSSDLHSADDDSVDDGMEISVTRNRRQNSERLASR